KRGELIEIGGIHDECIPLPVSDRVSQEKADILADVGSPVEVDDAREVAVLGEDHDFFGRLYELKRAVAQEKARQRATRVVFDIAQGSGGVGQLQEFSPL